VSDLPTSKRARSWRGPLLIAAGVAGLVLLGLLVLEPRRSDDGPGEREDRPSEGLPTHTLMFGGDVFTARQLNRALFDDESRAQILGGLAPLLRQADLSMLNSEGVIATGGAFYSLGRSSYMFHAHPLLIDVYRDVGIDLLTLGNNHMPDYGPASLVEMTHRLRAAGIGYTGAGVDAADAKRPVYRRVGDTVVAVVGGELTYAKRYRATKKRAGGHYHKRAFMGGDGDRANLKHYAKIAREARKHAHVVIFSPHWDARKSPPVVSDAMREFAEDILSAGYDAILGHGRHDLQGVEVFDGKPVLYDAGNVLTDYARSGTGAASMLWEVSFSRAGVTGLRAIPIAMTRNRTTLATGEQQTEVLQRLNERSAVFDTRFELRDGAAHLELDPGGVEGPSAPVDPPMRAAVDAELLRSKLAPSVIRVDALPPDATALRVGFGEDLELLGYRLVLDALVGKATEGQLIILYFRALTDIQRDYMVDLEARPVDGGVVRKTGGSSARHAPGDWLWPTTHWKKGEIVQDLAYPRFQVEPSDAVRFAVGLRRVRDSRERGRLVKPTSHGAGVVIDGNRVVLGQTPRRDDAPSPRKVWEHYQRQRPLEPSAIQPWGNPPPGKTGARAAD